MHHHNQNTRLISNPGSKLTDGSEHFLVKLLFTKALKQRSVSLQQIDYFFRLSSHENLDFIGYKLYIKSLIPKQKTKTRDVDSKSGIAFSV